MRPTLRSAAGVRATRAPGPLHREVRLPRVTWSSRSAEERIVEIFCSKHVPLLDREQQELA
jgi:hypothetical protein